MDVRDDKHHPVVARMPLLLTMLGGVLLIMFMLRQCSTPAPFIAHAPAHSAGDTIDVAIEYAPMSMYRRGDTLGGFGYEMLRQLCADSMVIKFHPIVSVTDAAALLRNGVYDMVVSDMPLTTDYDSTICFTVPVYLDRQVLVQRVDSTHEPIVSALSLAGRRVAVAANSPMMYRLKNLGEEIGDTIIVVADSIYGSEQLFLKVAVGDYDYAVVNERVARRLAPDYPHVDIATGISLTQFQAWMLRPDNSRFNARIDSAILRFRRTDAYRRLMSGY